MKLTRKEFFGVVAASGAVSSSRLVHAGAAAAYIEEAGESCDQGCHRRGHPVHSPRRSAMPVRRGCAGQALSD